MANLQMQMVNNMIYFRKFFEDLPFFKAIETKSDDNSKRLCTYLKDPTQVVFQQEIDKWLKIAYEHNIVDNFKKRLSGNVTFIGLQCILNELMVAYFVHVELKMRIKQYSPAVKNNKMADWLFEKDNQAMYVEVKTPWEERREGTFGYSQYDKLFESIRKKYSQRPKNKEPFVIFITDELNLSPAVHKPAVRELTDALYGKRAIVFHEFNGKSLKQPSYEVVDRRSIFQQNIRRNLSGVAVLKFMVWFDDNLMKDIGKHHFILFHNPYCFKECRLDPEWFKPFKQYVPNFEKGKMEWLDTNAC